MPGADESHSSAAGGRCPRRCSSLVFPLGFRLTCYYYRKAYYRSFWLSPPACAVAEPHAKYTGETRFPLILQNVHRYFFYLGVVLALILTYDAVIAFRDRQGDWGHMGLGTLLLLVNAVLLWAYTLSCHSCRHIDRRPAEPLLQAPGPLPAVDAGVALNGRHMQLGLDLAGQRRASPTSTSTCSPPAHFTDPRFF